MVAKSGEGVKVNIMGRDYVVACGEDERDNLVSAASYLDKQMRVIQRSSKLMGHERCAVMAALNISHELLLQREKGSAGSKTNGEDGKRLAKMQQKIDLVLQAQH